MRDVFANRNEKSDFIINEFENRTHDGCDMYVASAFFTNAEVIENVVKKGCNVFMVVRLGFPTNPDALEKAIKHPNVQVRYYTGRSFHPKLYIFGSDAALVGSANLTYAALMSNQEVMVAIDSSDKRFIELMNIFEEYWDEAEVLTPQKLAIYRKFYVEFAKNDASNYNLGQKVLKELGDRSPSNITRDRVKVSKQSLFTSNFRKTYQEAVAAFNIVRSTYQAVGYRKVDENLVPLRIEVDSFISFVRQKVAAGDSWSSTPLRNPMEQSAFVKQLIEEWRQTEWPYFEETVTHTTYPRLRQVFASRETIMAANDSDLFDALATLHSFHDRYRFFEGGLSTWKRDFPTFNDAVKTRETLAYLVFGSGDIVERMANAIFSPQYKLNEFGQANVQELVGWCNHEDLPIINGRTTKILRFFGSKVRQLA